MSHARPFSESPRPRVAINGLGRIGRALLRIAAEDANCPFDIVAANDLADVGVLAWLTRRDTVHGGAKVPVHADGDAIVAGRHRVVLSSITDPTALPWSALGVDVVVESTGRFRTRAQAAAHLKAGARRVVISAPGESKDPPDATVVMGINHGVLRPEHTVISAASCTTTCLAPVAHALHAAFGIVQGTMTTVHAYTADQALVDTAHKKEWRRGRSAAQNIVPTSTGAAAAIGLVLPELQGRLHGIALRVPVPDVSLVDLVAQVERPATIASVNQVLRTAAAAASPGTLRIEDEPVVSSDLIGEVHGSVVDSALTHVQGDRLVKVVAWYDNEGGYANRLYALVQHYAALT
ncbi:MAG: type I glyceraldehyde-3-phosphate dehydrogenase [Myxococcales bacterium]|nr:type I glyceraldehyde-3-phosphate dehydrogenase [Myxococcales bacterium]